MLKEWNFKVKLRLNSYLIDLNLNWADLKRLGARK